MARQRIAEVLSCLWQRQWLLLEQQKAGAAAGEDPECLHRLRVVLRHTRALLKVFKRELPRLETDRFTVELKWLAAATGKVRDLDVQIADLRAWAAAQGRDAETALVPVVGRLTDERATAQQRLQRVLASKRFQRLTKRWSDFVTSLPQLGLAADTAPARKLAVLKIAKQSLRLVKAGLVIKRSSTAQQLHSLRIRGKRLRYVVESLASLFDGGDRRSFLPELKVLQQALGDYRDSDLGYTRTLTLLTRSKGWPQALPWLLAWRDELASRRRRARIAVGPAIAAFATVCQRLPG